MFLINPGETLSYMSILRLPNLRVATTTRFLSDIFDVVVFIVVLYN